MKLPAAPGELSIPREKSLLRLVVLPRSLCSREKKTELPEDPLWSRSLSLPVSNALPVCPGAVLLRGPKGSIPTCSHPDAGNPSPQLINHYQHPLQQHSLSMQISSSVKPGGKLFLLGKERQSYLSHASWLRGGWPQPDLCSTLRSRAVGS